MSNSKKQLVRDQSLETVINKHCTTRPFKCETCASAFKTNANLKVHQKWIHSDAIPSFQCDQCPKRFRDNNGLNRHKSSHSDERPFSCEICDKNFKLKRQLKAHLRSVHSDDPSFNCKICSKRFSTKNSLSRHMMIHTGEKPHKCQFCKNKEFTRKGDLKNHIKSRHSVTSTTFTCDLCPKQYRHKITLRYHLITNHNRGDNPESWLHCKVCQKSFGTNAGLNSHLRSHTLPHKCGVCGKGFRSKNKLEVHISGIHTKEKTNECYFCSKSFNEMKGLIAHLRIHTKERPFKCSVCKKRFNHKGNLVRHLKQH